MAALDLILTASTGGRYLPRLRQHLLAAHRLLRPRPPLRELSLALVGDRRMERLHRQFLGLRGSTDVLTFPLEFDPRGRPVAGEVVVCVPQALRQSRLHATALADELLLYALHGLLHLCGFDDRTRADFAAMHRQEDLILGRLGRPRPRIGSRTSRLSKRTGGKR